MKRNIYLIGFMGTGKSTVSKALSELLGYREIDTDEEIVQQQQKKIPEIFDLYGEAHFRKLETELLDQMREYSHCIISCGGGMVLRNENVQKMTENGVVVLLKAEPQTILSRVRNGRERPLLNGHMNVEYIGELMAKRSPYYEAAGELVIETDGKTPTEIAEEIKKNLKSDKFSFAFF